MRRALIVLLAMSVVLVGCDKKKASSDTVKSGSFCSTSGQTGKTSSGTVLTCETSSTDTKLRWRSAP